MAHCVWIKLSVWAPCCRILLYFYIHKSWRTAEPGTDCEGLFLYVVKLQNLHDAWMLFCRSFWHKLLRKGWDLCEAVDEESEERSCIKSCWINLISHRGEKPLKDVKMGRLFVFLRHSGTSNDSKRCTVINPNVYHHFPWWKLWSQMLIQGGCLRSRFVCTNVDFFLDV